MIDFGIARHFKPGKAKDTIPLGSKGYAAPEQYGKAQTTPQSDIYGLGATLHQLLTGDDPSLTLFHFAPVHLGKSPIAAPLNAILKQMVEMEMSKRPANMAIVKQELQRLLAQQTARRLSPAQKTLQAKVQRRRFVLGLISTAAVFSSSIAITTLLTEKPYLSLFAETHALNGNPVSPSTAVLSPARVKILSTPLYTYRGHKGAVTAVAWSPDGQDTASAGTLDSSVQVWDASTGNIVLVSALEIDPTEKRLPTRKKVPALFATNNQRVDALAWSSERPSSSPGRGPRIAAALQNDTVHIWNLEMGDDTFIPFSQPGNTNALAWSPHGDQIAAVSGNILVQVYSATTGKLFPTYTGHSKAVHVVAWSPDGEQIASGGADGTVQVWSAVTGDYHVTYPAYPAYVAQVNAVTWSPDGKYIASGGSDGAVQVWEVDSGHTLFTYQGHTDGVNALAWQPNQGARKPNQGARKGTPLLYTELSGYAWRIASGGADATVQVWSLGKASTTTNRQAMALQGEVLMYRGHTAQVTSVTWSPDGQYIASGSADGTVQVWRAM